MSKFVEQEKGLLTEICRKYPVLMDKGYGIETITKKKETWIEVQKEFNSANPGKPGREISQLQGLWKRLKIKARAKIDEARKDSKKTGGGPAKPPLGTYETILAEMFEGQFEPLNDTLDDDAISFQEGPGEELEIGEPRPGSSGIEMEKNSNLPEKKMKKFKQNGEEQFYQAMLEMAEKEHREKMDVLKLKKEKAKLKVLLLKEECKLKNVLF